MIDSLRLCAAHKIPINTCAPCWPIMLAHLCHLCSTDTMRQRQWIPRASLSKPTQKEQIVFARQLRMQ